jgi:hypothetical protein
MLSVAGIQFVEGTSEAAAVAFANTVAAVVAIGTAAGCTVVAVAGKGQNRRANLLETVKVRWDRCYRVSEVLAR